MEEVRGSGVAKNLMGADSPEMDEWVVAALVNVPLVMNFVKNANKARVEGIEGEVNIHDGTPLETWEEFMWHEVMREQLGNMGDFILTKHGLNQETLVEHRQTLLRRLIDDYKDKSFDEILYLLS